MLAGLQASPLLCQINIPSPAHTSCLEMMGYQLRPHPYSCPPSRRKRRTQQKTCSALRKHHSIKDEEIRGQLAPVPCCWHEGYMCALRTAYTISSLGWATDQICKDIQGSKKSTVFINPRPIGVRHKIPSWHIFRQVPLKIGVGAFLQRCSLPEPFCSPKG